MPSVRDISAAEIPKAAQVLSKAFGDDPMFMFIFGKQAYYERVAPWMFSTWVRWCMLYSRAWCTPGVEAVALRRPPGAYHMSFSSIIRAGMLPTPIKLGLGSYRHFNTVISALERKHQAIMAGTPHWYCQTLAVLPEEQGRGLGKALMNHTFKLADEANLPCYLETAADTSLAIHKKQGYEVREVLTFSNCDLTMFLMVRSPQQ